MFGDSLSSALVPRESAKLDDGFLDYIKSHAPLDDSIEKAVDFLKNDPEFNQRFPNVGNDLASHTGNELAIRTPAGLASNKWIACLVGCLTRTYGINWVNGRKDSRTGNYVGGTRVTNGIYADISACAVGCTLSGMCGDFEAATWQSQQDTSGMTLHSKE
ncbi:hypothetical protein ACLMJK_009370 [Lecanora helva]